MAPQVLVAGVGMVPFRRPGHSDPYDIMAEAAVRTALDDAQVDYDLVDQAFASFVYADSCSGQRALYRVGMTGIPIVNVNNNCASGSTALHLARTVVLSGEADCALAVGFEEMRPGALDRVFPHLADPIAAHLQCVGDAIGLSERERSAPPALLLFAAQLEHMRTELGLDDEIFAQVAVKSRAHAANNPNAIFREPLTISQVLAEPPVLGSLRKLYACAPSCGAAAVIVCSPRFAARHGLAQRVTIRAQVILSDSAGDLDHPNVLDALGRDATRRAARHAYELAGVGPEDIDVAEVHDCFVSNELIACSSLGFCNEHELAGFVAEGRNTYGGNVVVGPSGGLLSKGHPLGATGLAQIAELTWQLRGQAGGRQVERARTALQHNLGVGSSLCVTILQTC